MKKYILLLGIILGCTFVGSSAHAERLTTVGFEMGTSTTGVEITQNGLDASAGNGIETSTVHSGTWAMGVNAFAAGGFSWFRIQYKSANSVATTTVRAYLNFSRFPASTIDDVWSFTNSAAGITMPLRINSSGQLAMFDSAGTQCGASSTALSLNTWNYVEEQIQGASTNAHFTLNINGTTAASCTNAVSATFAQTYFGPALGNGGAYTMFIDDIAVNDTTGSNENGFPGAGNEILYRPGATGDVNNWLQTGGAASSTNNWTMVNDQPPNDGTNYVEARATSTQDLYGVVSSSTLPTGATINTVQVGVRYGGSATTIPQFNVEAEKTTGGTIASSTAIAPNATGYKTNTNTTAVGSYPLTMDVNPDGAAWTNSTIGTMQIGEIISTGAVTNFARISSIWAYVDYVPGGGGGATNAISNTMGLGFFQVANATLAVKGSTLVVK